MARTGDLLGGATLSRTELRVLTVVKPAMPMSKFEIIAAVRMQKWSDTVFQITSAIRGLVEGGALSATWSTATFSNNWQIEQTFVRAVDTHDIDMAGIAPTFLEKLNYFIAQMPPKDTDWGSFK